MRWLPLFLCSTLCFGAPAKKPSQPDKVHLSLTYSERNGLAFPSAGGIGLVTVPLLGGAALASALGGIGNLGSSLNDLFSGKDAGVPKTGGEMERMMSSPQGDALVALASRLPLSCSYRAQLEADLVWDVSRRAYVVSSGTLTWTGRNNSRFESKGLLLYCNLSGGGNHRLTRDEVMVKFSNGDLSKALAAKGKQETLTYELILDVKPKEEAITGDAGYLSQSDGHVVYQTQDRFTTTGQMTNVNVIDGSLKENVKAEPLMFSKNLAYQAEEREIREGNADFSETWMAPGGTQTAIRWTFDLPMDEVFVEPDGAYDTWLPKGNLENAEKGGNTLMVRVSVHKKGDSGKPGKAKVVFKLADVSMEKGVCMNWPRKTAKSGHGLKFIQDEKKNLDVVGPDEAKTKNYVENAQAAISAFDFGAWGTLQVTAQDEQGRNLRVHVRGREKSELSLPLDENRNHIADGWELDNVGDLRGQDGDDQETQPKGKSECPGDGLSLYEEYRGFRVQGDHIRTDPQKKDLFLCDNTSGKVAAAGTDLLESATKLKVWSMTYEEMGSDRLINRNGAGGLAHLVDQHGILIEDGPNGIDPRQVPISEEAPFGPPVLTLFVQLPPGRSYASGDGQADVAHELCHAVGLCHHGDANLFAVEWFWMLEADGTWQLYEQGIAMRDVQTARDNTTTQWVPIGDRKPIQAIYELDGRPFRKGDPGPPGSATVSVERWRLQIAGEQSQFSGDQECLMRYADKQAYLAKRDPEHIRYLPDKSQWRARNRLCTDSKGTGVNEEGHAPQSRYGEAVVGNCRSQLVINDKYAK